MRAASHRPVTATIHLNHLEENIKQIKKTLKPHQLFYAVVKADAYGHGAVPIAQKASKVGVDGFCVAMLDEALELRNAGIQEPILVLGVSNPKDAPVFIEHHITATVDSLAFLESAARYIHSGNLAIHLALNTGMNRLGLQTSQEVAAFENKLDTLACFSLEGVFTHFATADGENDNQVRQQAEKFKELLRAFRQKPRHVHLANTAMTMWHQQFDTDIVRIGIGMYGINPSDYVLEVPYPLKPVLTWETEISHVHLLKRGESVSYGAKYIAKQDEWLAVLPVGYADGFRRSLQAHPVYIENKACQILGVVCMDQMMIRVDKPYPIGTKVELIGVHNTAESLAMTIGTIGYEIVCGISQRVPRVYIDNTID